MRKVLFIGSPALLVGVVTGALLSKWTTIEATFWAFTLVDVANLLLTLAIAFIVTNIVTEKLNNSVRKRELVLDVLDKLLEMVKVCHDAGLAYMRKPEDTDGRFILSSYKKIDNMIAFVQRLKDRSIISCRPILDNSVIDKVREHKTILTDKQFLTHSPSYDAEIVKQLEDKYSEIQLKLIDCKISLFS